MNQNNTPLFKKLDWANTLFLVLTPIFSVVGTFYLVKHGLLPTATVILAVIMGIATGLSVTCGYHRLFSHRSFEANSIVKLILLLFGAASFENSARRWCADHRMHHKYVDTDLDPYNINRGFWYAHMGWVCLKTPPSPDDNIRDILADPLVRFQDRYYVPIAISVGFILPTVIASFWGNPWGGFIVGGLLRTVLNHHFTFFINSYCHMFGRRPYSDLNTSRDSWFIAFFTYGEGYHNFHHRFPSDYRNGIRLYDWDPTKWLIRFLSWIGWAGRLHRVPVESILQARLKMQEKRIILRMEKAIKPVTQYERNIVAKSRKRFEEAYVKFRSLKKEYTRLKQEKLNALSGHLAFINQRIEALKQELRKARLALREAMGEWIALCNSFGVNPERLVYSSSFRL